jgi:hypothetical protein
MIMGSRRYGARFGTAVANVGDLNLDGYEGKQLSYTLKMHPYVEDRRKCLVVYKSNYFCKTFYSVYYGNLTISQTHYSRVNQGIRPHLLSLFIIHLLF